MGIAADLPEGGLALPCKDVIHHLAPAGSVEACSGFRNCFVLLMEYDSMCRVVSSINPLFPLIVLWKTIISFCSEQGKVLVLLGQDRPRVCPAAWKLEKERGTLLVKEPRKWLGAA